MHVNDKENVRKENPERKTPTQVLYCEFCKISKTLCFMEYLWWLLMHSKLNTFFYNQEKQQKLFTNNKKKKKLKTLLNLNCKSNLELVI